MLAICTGIKDVHEAVAFELNRWDCPLCEALDRVRDLESGVETLRYQLERRGMNPEY